MRDTLTIRHSLVFISVVLRQIVFVEVNDGSDKIVPHYDGADALPFAGVLVQQQADRLQRHLDAGGGVGHRPNLNQVLLLDRLDRYAQFYALLYRMENCHMQNTRKKRNNQTIKSRSHVKNFPVNFDTFMMI